MLLFFLTYGAPFVIAALYFGLMTKARVSGLVSASCLFPVLALVAVPLIATLYGPVTTPKEQVGLTGMLSLSVFVLQLAPIVILLAARWNKVDPA